MSRDPYRYYRIEARELIDGLSAGVLALGADWTNAGRGFMFALGCVQSLTCNTNQCPTGVATLVRVLRQMRREAGDF